MNKYDPRYQRGKIYTITCEDGAIYIGSTIQTLNDRLAIHKSKNQICSMYYYIRDNYDGDWSKCKIELYEKYPCNNKKELNRKEGEITQLIGTINKQIAGRTRYEYERNRKNKKERNKYIKIKIECDCGCLFARSHLSRHLKTQKHQDLMDNQTSAILSFLECF